MEFVSAKSRWESASVAELQAMHQAYQGEEDEPEFESPILTRMGSLGLIHISGPMSDTKSKYAHEWGVVPYYRIYDALVEAADTSDIAETIMLWDTNGGSVAGIGQAAEGIEEARKIKPVHSYVTGKMLSAGIWLGSGTDSISMDEDSEIGSVGVLAVTMNYSEMLKKSGIEVNVFRTSPKKAMINPFEKMSDEAKEQLSASMQRSHDKFEKRLVEGYGLPQDYVHEKVATGEVFQSDQAVTLGLAERVVSYNDYFREKLQQHEEGSQQNNPYGTVHSVRGIAAQEVGAVSDVIEPKDSNMKHRKVVTSDKVQAAALEGIELPAGEEAAETSAAQEGEQAADIGAGSSDEKAAGQEVPAGEAAEASAEQQAKDRPSNDGMTQITDKYIKAVEDLASAKAELSGLKADKMMSDALIKQFSSITAESINRHHVILGSKTQDLSSLTPGTLLEMYNDVHAKVTASFPTGQQSVEAPQGKEVDKVVSNFEQYAHLTRSSK